jgi:hypothetical protein
MEQNTYKVPVFLSGQYTLEVKAVDEDAAIEAAEREARRLFAEHEDFDVPEGEEEGLVVEVQDAEEVDPSDEVEDDDDQPAGEDEPDEEEDSTELIGDGDETVDED